MKTPRGTPLLASLLLAAAGGLLLWLAFPAWDLWPLAVAGPALLQLAAYGQRARRGAVVGGVLGAAFMLPLLSWSGVFVGSLPWVALSVAQALFYAALGAGVAAVSRLPAAPLWSALLWVAAEGARSRWPFGGLPWGRLGFAQADSPLAQLAAVGGVPLVSFAVALSGCGLANVVVTVLRRDAAPGRPDGRYRRRIPALALAIAPWLAVIPLGPTGDTPPGGSTQVPARVDIAVVQGGVPRAGLDFNAQRRAVLDNHVQATVDLAAEVAAGRRPAPQLVLWPENSSDIDPLINPDAAEQIDRAARAIGVPILIGAVLDGPGGFLTNAGIVWDPVTGPGDQYAKRHPVPFGEYMPARSFFRLFSDKVDLLRRDFRAGETPGLLDMGGVAVGDVICFEVAYDGLVADVVAEGAQLLVVQTNNATFGYTDESPQQLAMSRLRAIEFDRPVVVVATSGLSAVIESDGSVRARSDLFTQWVFTGAVTLGEGTTVAARLGSAPEAAMSGLAVAALLWTWGRRRTTGLAADTRVVDPATASSQASTPRASNDRALSRFPIPFRGDDL
ncbi:apolipoprotein N-acyltransferase [Klenkia sp. PcliD-1-E]|uniref:apolipoprotein N-acyltransferase n=1 Tax=Klenkia sp. PcliD-1-E TaxID=2954492 RepID=UPI0020982C9D|nr:apolipoprotein N-acyltransferase [Klenkia sp. PcliD-1-E]MCO7218305.1 apolipoprotein N-acyltransferase [Klenkia sp. PcliD-1-E]